MKSVEAFIYKWLPIYCGCHCRKDRSFHYKGKQFPVCARCTGVLIGNGVGAFIYFMVDITWWMYMLMMIPLVVDGFVQLKTSYESTNLKRVITGFFFGIGLVGLFFMMLESSYHFGKYLKRYFNGTA